MNKKTPHTLKKLSPTALAMGNQALRNGNYAEAIMLYKEFLKDTPELKEIITANLSLANKKNNKDKSTNLTLNNYHIDSSNKYLLTTSPENQRKIAVVVHYFYPDIWFEIKEKLTALPPIFDLFVTVPHEKAEVATKDILSTFPLARIHIGRNIGMDIIPFLSLIPTLINENYYAVCKIQTKKGDGHLAVIWRQVMLNSLIGSPQNFTRAVNAFKRNDRLCLIGPAALYQSAQRLMYDNAHNLSRILATAYETSIPMDDWGFFAGTMFWSKVDILEKLAKSANFCHSSLDEEYKKDGKLEHALERFFGLLPVLHNGKIGLLQPKQRRHEDCEVLICEPVASVGQAHIGDVMRQLERIEQDAILIKKSGYFSTDYYINQNPELAGISIDYIYHYLTQGCYREKFPCQNFFAIFEKIVLFLKEQGDNRNPFLFFIDHNGDNSKILDHINKNSCNRSIIFDKEFTKKTGLFDNEFYARQFPKIRDTGKDPLDHYFREGTFAELYPNQYFIPREYRVLHGDVVEAGVEPFYHYLTSGALEGRRYRTTKWREEEETPFFRYMVLNETLIDWKNITNREPTENFVSIVIPIYNQLELTKSCLYSVLRARTKLSYEVICVDNGSQSEMAKFISILSSRDRRIKLIKNKENYNFSIGCNIGFEASHGEFIVFLNNDTTVTDDWLDELIQPFSDTRIVAIQPKLIYPDETIQNIGIVFAPKQAFGYPIYANFPPDELCVNVSRNYQAITAACMAIRATDFAKAKGFDPIFINGQEDIDLCLRLTHGTDRVCYYQASSVVVHHESKTQGRGKYIKLNRKNFFERWHNKIEPDDFKYYADDKFKIAKWNKDTDEMVKAGIGISRPTLEKVEAKISRIRFFWNAKKEQQLKIKIYEHYLENKSLYRNHLISIIMPTYNRANVIENAIKSVLQQTHQNFELHICDDGSTDETQHIIAKYLHDNRVRLHQLPHIGVSGARNKGLDMAQGQLIAYLDSDNTWSPDFLEIMLVVTEIGMLDAAYSAIHAINDKGDSIYRGDVFDWAECLKENYIDMNAFVHKKTTIRFDETLKRLVDWDFILRVAKNIRIAYAPFIGVNYYDGDMFSRITKNEYIGDKLAEMQTHIRTKHDNDHVLTCKSINIESLFTDQKLPSKHTISQSTIPSSSFIVNFLKFRIKIGCPNLNVSHEWGDYHFANSMKRSLESFGHQCVVDCLDDWESIDSLTADVVIVLRGLSRYTPKSKQINLMWNISHPDKISLDEYAEYDHIFVASVPYAKKLKKQLTTPVSALLQCTDPLLFNPSVAKKHCNEVLFVGNSRNVYRKIVKDAIQADLPLSVYGNRWEQFIPKKYIISEYISNNELASYYAGAKIILNDHWDTMREYGFLSNRLFDAAACAALVVTDPIEGLSDIFDDSILTYNSPTHLREIYHTSFKEISNQRVLIAEKICTTHSFHERVKVILSICNNLLTDRKPSF